jgi:DNA-binding transcriptional ArsR family regulator
MPVRAKQTTVDRLFGALANPTRRDILDLLLGGERTAGQIAESFDMARPSVSEHLRVLLDCDLVDERAEGRNVYYRTAAEPLLAVRDWLTPHERFWRERMRAMGDVLNEIDPEQDHDERLPRGEGTPS